MAETTRSTPMDFLREVREQLQKVTWPDLEQLKSSTGVIVLFMLVNAAVIFAMDRVVLLVLNLISSLLGT